MNIHIMGAGVIGLACAVELASQGMQVSVFERNADLASGCSHYAGGMLAPFCESFNSEAFIVQAGLGALTWWQQHCPNETTHNGSLVVAGARDKAELELFASRTSEFTRVDEQGIASLEDELAGRFRSGLFYADEGLIDPRRALLTLVKRIEALGSAVKFGVDAHAGSADLTIDCRGLQARDVLPELRGVKGEMILVHSPDVNIERVVRLLRPRQPIYLIPRGSGVYMLGATMIETDEPRVTARSVAELLSGAYAIHPAFADAEILETGAGVRPAFPDNLPRIIRDGNVLHVNGAFRHGFLLAPALARMCVDMIVNHHSFEEAQACILS